MAQVFVVMGIAVMVFVAGAFVGEHEVRKEAVERGYALHCPNTGSFAWKGECDTTPTNEAE